MSTRITMDERRKALEEEFFQRQERKLLERLREKSARDRSIAELRELSGIADEVVLGHLVDAEVSAETLMAFTLVPLVSVAWANGSVEEAERDAVLRAADEAGVRTGTAAYAALERMLEERPSRRLLTIWCEYARCLHGHLSESKRAGLVTDVVGRARGVAEAAGGLLGLGAVSAAEESVLSQVEDAVSEGGNGA